MNKKGFTQHLRIRSFQKSTSQLNLSAGFTFVEILLYLTIATLLLGTISVLMVTIYEGRIRNSVVREVHIEGERALRIMSHTIRNAQSISSPTQGNAGISLTLAVDAGVDTPTVFDVEQGRIRMTEGAQTPVYLTNSYVEITELTFRNVSYASTPGTVSILMRISYINQTGREEYNYQKVLQTSVSLRP